MDQGRAGSSRSETLGQEIEYAAGASVGCSQGPYAHRCPTLMGPLVICDMEKTFFSEAAVLSYLSACSHGDGWGGCGFSAVHMLISACNEAHVWMFECFLVHWVWSMLACAIVPVSGGGSVNHSRGDCR